MNDDDLITVLREQRRKVPMATPVEQIIRRSRALRARRRIPAVTGVLALAAGAAVAVTALVPASHAASHQPGHPAHAQLAAWTVSKQSDGTVFVKIREFRDPAGLQRKLRAEGVPASIIFVRDLVTRGNRVVRIKTYPCRSFNGGHWSTSRLVRVAHLVDPQAADPFLDGLVIHPSALPRHAGVQFYISTNFGSNTQHYGTFLEGLVQTSPQCTGS